MRERTRFEPHPDSARLWSRRRGERTELWTEAVGAPPPVYAERWTSWSGRALRTFEPARSKLSAALARGWSGPIPAPEEAWLYLGAASGTTASHVADLVGPAGRVYAVERSLRPFARLLHLAQRWPNLLPILGDAREPERYADRVPLVDGVYADVAQPDQVALLLANVELFLRDRTGRVVLALKTSSIQRGVPAPAHLRAAEEALGRQLTLAESVRLDPFHRSHYLVGGTRGEGPAIGSGRLRFDRAPRPRRGRPALSSRGRAARRP